MSKDQASPNKNYHKKKSEGQGFFGNGTKERTVFFIVGTNKINNGHRFVSNKIYLNVWYKQFIIHNLTIIPST